VPLDDFQSSRKTLNFVGYEGIAMIAIAGIDMAIWDALAQAAALPLAVMLGGSLAPVPAYNSNGLWLSDIGTLGKEAANSSPRAEFKALKARLGRERIADDIEAISDHPGSGSAATSG